MVVKRKRESQASAADGAPRYSLCANAPHCKEVGAAGVYFFKDRLYCKTCRLGGEAKLMRTEWIAQGSPPAEDSIANIRRLLAQPKEWTGEVWNTHWRKLADGPGRPHSVGLLANEALRKLHPYAPPSREPGADDEPGDPAY